MRTLLLALTGLLTLTLPARADLYPGSYGTYITGGTGSSPSSPYVTFGFANIPGYGVTNFYTGLNPNTFTITFGTHIYQADTPSLDLTNVEFVGNRTADYISGFTLDPSSTITGIVASSYVSQPASLHLHQLRLQSCHLHRWFNRNHRPDLPLRRANPGALILHTARHGPQRRGRSHPATPQTPLRFLIAALDRLPLSSPRVS